MATWPWRTRSFPKRGGGQGIASSLAKYALEHAKNQGVKVEVYCTYVAGYLKSHPEYQPLVVRSV